MYRSYIRKDNHLVQKRNKRTASREVELSETEANGGTGSGTKKRQRGRERERGGGGRGVHGAFLTYSCFPQEPTGMRRSVRDRRYPGPFVFTRVACTYIRVCTHTRDARKYAMSEKEKRPVG